MTNSKNFIRDYDFNDSTPDEIINDDFFIDWPVVYIINNDKEMYIGETYHAPERMKQHLKREDRRKLNSLHLIGSIDFTKSATLDIESSLIELCKIGNKRELQNANDGLVNHNFANKNNFRKDSKFFIKLWKELVDRGLVEGDIENIINSELFKYSPYKALNAEQCTTRDYILEEIEECFNKDLNRSIFVNGSAGTGKTILAIYLLKLLATNDVYLTDNEDDNDGIPYFVKTLSNIKQLKPNLKIAYVVSMTSLRNTLKEVFSSIKGLSSSMVIGPSEVFKEKYDVLIVDEAHRLKQRKNLTAHETFDINNKKLGLGNEGTELDWILYNSKIQILFYDEEQTVKPTDVNSSRFIDLINKDGNSRHNLSSQMRCLAGHDYIKYVKNILNEKQDTFIEFNNDNYEFKLFDDIDDLTNTIYEKEKESGLSRIVSGYGYKWDNKKKMKELYGTKKAPNKIDPSEIRDVVVGNKKFYWNRRNDKWPLSISGEQVKEEVGCIHTIQGYDLNYCGVIFGPEIVYRNGHIEIIKDKYFDMNGKRGAKDDEIKKYILNIYSVLMTRGIKGTYIYVFDDDLRNYFVKYINKEK